MSNGSINLASFLVKVLQFQAPVKYWLQHLRLAPEHCSSRKAELAVSLNVAEVELA